MNNEDRRRMIRAALAAREKAYAPYSGYQVGAALLTGDGVLYTGCNVENAAYSVCNCAERTALFKAVSEGDREFWAMAVVGGKDTEESPLSGFAYPCGVCRQALFEFSPNLLVIVARSEEEYQECSLGELLAKGFGGENLGREKHMMSGKI